MRKRVLSLAAIVALSPMGFAADSVEGMFKEGKVSGQVRAFYINRDIDAATDYTRDALALGGK
ncbi:MAG: porin, partial [Campylobacterales bacterium]